MSTNTDSSLATLKSLIKDNNIEDYFLKQLGLDSLDDLHPNIFKDLVSAKAPIVSTPAISSAPVPAPPLTRQTVDARKQTPSTEGSDYLRPFIGSQIVYVAKRRSSKYSPSCIMMDYIVHLMNEQLVDNHYFKRDCPNYHPYILRLYYGVIFWIQCLRAGLEAAAITNEQHQFLVQFLDCHPLESLPVAGPLLPLFKTLCASEPEIKSFGPVYPQVPEAAGPTTRSTFMVDGILRHFLPNVPGIFALLEHLDGLINAEQAIYPNKGKHIPVTSAATTPTIFGHHSFPVLATRSSAEKYALCSPGLQYYCEADCKLNESFAERYDSFEFPTLAANDNLETISSFLHMNKTMIWFSQVKLVAATAAAFINGSGNLADCSPFGIQSNQYYAVLTDTPVALPAPTHSADKGALYPFSHRLNTPVRIPAPFAAPMASMALTHMSMFANHPYLGTFGHPPGTGPFWDIRPIEKSELQEHTYLGLRPQIKASMKHKADR